MWESPSREFCFAQISVNCFQGSIATSYAQLNLVDPPQLRYRLVPGLISHQLSPFVPDFGDLGGVRVDKVISVEVYCISSPRKTTISLYRAVGLPC